MFILGRPPPELPVEALPLVPNPLVIVAPHDHALVNVPSIPLARVLKEPFLIRESGSGTRDAFLNLIEAKGLRPPSVRMELNSTEAIKQATAAGLGLSIMSLHALTLEGTDGPVAVLDVACSAGTYVRALARDLGAALGSGAYLGALTRPASGGSPAADALPLADVRAAPADGPDGLRPLLRPVDTGLEDWPLVVLTDAEVEDVVRGRFRRPPASPSCPRDYTRCNLE